MQHNIDTLNRIIMALNNVEVKGKNNHALLVASMNDIERVIKDLTERKEMFEDGDTHAES